MSCEEKSDAALGQYGNVGKAEGYAPDETQVTDEDPSHYLGFTEGQVACCLPTTGECRDLENFCGMRKFKRGCALGGNM